MSLSTISLACVSMVIKHMSFYLSGRTRSPLTNLMSSVSPSTDFLYYSFMEFMSPLAILRKHSSTALDHMMLLTNKVI